MLLLSLSRDRTPSLLSAEECFNEHSIFGDCLEVHLSLVISNLKFSFGHV